MIGKIRRTALKYFFVNDGFRVAEVDSLSANTKMAPKFS